MGIAAGHAQAHPAQVVEKDVGEAGEVEAQLVRAHGGGTGAIGEEIQLLCSLMRFFISPWA